MRRPVGLASALRARSLFRSRQQPDGCAPRGRTSCDGQSALPQHFVPELYSAHASSLTAALRGGALRAAASRPCLSTSCQEFIPLTLAAFGCAPRGRTSCGGQSALPQHFVPGVYSAHASSLRLRSAGAHFVRRPVGLASALRASGEYLESALRNSGTRPDGSRAGQARPRGAVGVSQLA